MKKKIISIVLVIFSLTVVAESILLISRKDFFGWRLNLSLSKVETADYSGLGPDISFKYPKIFEIDSDVNHQYGQNYVVGLKLKTDTRTGCDIRLGGPELNYTKSAAELANDVTGDIKNKTKDFKLLESSKMKIGGEDAFKVSFSFLDPIGARVRLDQISVKNSGHNFLIICGTGEYQYAFFKKDFQIFYDSLEFKNKLTK